MVSYWREIARLCCCVLSVSVVFSYLFLFLFIVFVFVLLLYYAELTLQPYILCALNTSGPGRSNDPCSEQFNGWKAFSEPETRAVADFILSLTSPTSNDDNDDVFGLVIYVSLHSYGQHLLTPWGYTRKLPVDYFDLVSRTTWRIHFLFVFFLFPSKLCILSG